MLNNPVSILNEFAQKKRVTFPVYNIVTEMGEPHNKMFRMNCIFMSFKTEGADKTKQDAKKKAAEEMVKLLVSKDYIPRPAEAQQCLKVLVPDVILRPLDSNLITNPIGWLQEHCMSKGWKIPQYEDFGVIDNTFQCRCTVQNFVASGSGFRKQMAKNNAASNMCHLINGTKCTTDFLTQINKLVKETVRKTPPSSPLSTLSADIDSLDSDSVDSPFQENSPEQNGEKQCKHSISLLHELVMLSKVPKPDFQYTDLEETAGRPFMCLCKVITLETCGFGYNKIEAKAKAADEMVNLIFVNAEMENTNNIFEEQRQKAAEYLRNLQKKEYGGEQNNKDEIAKRWLEIRKRFPSAKVKPTKGIECRERHCFFKNLKGECVGRLRNSSVEELVAQGVNFLKSLEKEQNFKFGENKISSYDKNELYVITLDAEVPLAFYGMDRSSSGAVQNSITNCIITLKMLLQ